MTELLKTIVDAADDKKAHDIKVIDLSGIDGAIADAFVVCSAESSVQVAAIADGIAEATWLKLKQDPHRIEGTQNAIWIAMDYIDVVVHIFQTQAREFYNLERLWS